MNPNGTSHQTLICLESPVSIRLESTLNLAVLYNLTSWLNMKHKPINLNFEATPSAFVWQESERFIIKADF